MTHYLFSYKRISYIAIYKVDLHIESMALHNFLFSINSKIVRDFCFIYFNLCSLYLISIRVHCI